MCLEAPWFRGCPNSSLGTENYLSFDMVKRSAIHKKRISQACASFYFHSLVPYCWDDRPISHVAVVANSANFVVMCILLDAAPISDGSNVITLARSTQP